MFNLFLYPYDHNWTVINSAQNTLWQFLSWYLKEQISKTFYFATLNHLKITFIFSRGWREAHLMKRFFCVLVKRFCVEKILWLCLTYFYGLVITIGQSLIPLRIFRSSSYSDTHMNWFKDISHQNIYKLQPLKITVNFSRK